MSTEEKGVSELRPEERLALVALLKDVALANNEVSIDEAQELVEICQALGETEFRRLMDETSKFADQAALREYLKTITNQESRELIYGLVMMEAGIDGIETSEAELLTWLAAEWGISVVPDGMEFQP